uniref:RxLR effector protein n=1 Tax=Peronospora matthiolae TaxID=2874970 RepID=A0AAV1UND5_9STRA
MKLAFFAAFSIAVFARSDAVAAGAEPNQFEPLSKSTTSLLPARPLTFGDLPAEDAPGGKLLRRPNSIVDEAPVLSADTNEERVFMSDFAPTARLASYIIAKCSKLADKFRNRSRINPSLT